MLANWTEEQTQVLSDERDLPWQVVFESLIPSATAITANEMSRLSRRARAVSTIIRTHQALP